MLYKPGDFIVIYRSGDRYPKKYSSVCTCLAVLEDIIYPKSKEEYLKECSNKSVFTKDELNDFFDSKNYRKVIKLILYKTYFEKISLSQLIDAGFIGDCSGPRPFDEVPSQYYKMFLQEEEYCNILLFLLIQNTLRTSLMAPKNTNIEQELLKVM